MCCVSNAHSLHGLNHSVVAIIVMIQKLSYQTHYDYGGVRWGGLSVERGNIVGENRVDILKRFADINDVEVTTPMKLRLGCSWILWATGELMAILVFGCQKENILFKAVLALQLLNDAVRISPSILLILVKGKVGEEKVRCCRTDESWGSDLRNTNIIYQLKCRHCLA